jgi:low temperature requirement protein LtrA
VSEQHAERAQRVTPLELLFDLVFAFAFTQVTTVLSDHPTWSGLEHVWGAKTLFTARDRRDLQAEPRADAPHG